ncbi:MAG: hypothetical protein JWN13_7056 [Betaproteobacteria bacterium]|jgi:hypothetical protein|nr:hypothetical protein [Betaproteobacteria bacterium]MEA3154348.1 hypothetical protein [Betaproteobacteria bacterium]
MLFGTMIELPSAGNSNTPAQSNRRPGNPRSRGRVVIAWVCCAIAIAALLLA